MSPTQTKQDNGNAREAILIASLKTFARYGYEGASLPKIAQLANVAPTLIHYHFGTKDLLWRETVNHSLGELRREATAIAKATCSLAPLDRLRALLQVICNFAAHWPDHFFMIIAEARADTKRFEWVQTNYTGALFEEVVGLLNDARKAGIIRDVRNNEVATTLVAGILLNFTVYPSRLSPKDREAAATAYCDQMFEVLLLGVSDAGLVSPIV